MAKFDLIAYIESQQRGAAPDLGATEKRLMQAVLNRCPEARVRPGMPLPDHRMVRDLCSVQASRDLQLGNLSGANLAGAVHNPLAEVAGAARPALVLERAGVAVTQIDDAQEASLPRWRGDGGGWLAEGQTMSSAGLTLSSVAVRAHNAGAVVKYSRKLRHGTQGDLHAFVVAEMARQVARTVEHGLIQGTGSNGQPLGLINQAAGAVTFAAALPTFSEVLAMVEALADADGDLGAASWLLHPSDAAALARQQVVAGTGQMIIQPIGVRQWAMAGLPMFLSRNAPEGKLILLDPVALKIAFFGPPQLLADPYSGSNSISGATSVIVSNYVDLGVAEPDLIIVGSV